MQKKFLIIIIDIINRILENARNGGRSRVCIECENNYCSPKDCQTYLCINGHKRGHLAFTPDRLKNFKSRGTPLQCTACLNDAAQRETALLRILRQADSWKCTCKKIATGKRAYAALYERLGHKSKCVLSPSYAGERRWDGKKQRRYRRGFEIFTCAEKQMVNNCSQCETETCPINC